MSSEPELDNIDETLLELVPEKVARDYCVLPASLEGSILTLFCPEEPDYEMKNGPILEFVLNRKLRWCHVPRFDIESAIARFHPFSEPAIHNCNIRFSFNCPKIWASLSPTDIATQRMCDECGKTVHLCSTEQEAIELGRKDRCVAYVDPEHGMILGEIDTEN